MSISHLVWPCREVRSVARRAVAVLTVLFTAALGLAVSATGVSAEPAAVGYRDFSYAADGVDAPTGEKPQSKLWFAGGSWWGALFSTATDSYNIYRLNRSTQTWVDTGVQLDDRNSARLDVLWDGSRLYVAGAGRSQSASSDRVEVSRYSYDSTSGSYSRDAGFPVTVASGGTEAVVIDKDSTGELWVTYTRDNRVYVAHSTTSDASWTTPFVIPVSGADTLTSDDISSVVAYDGNIGVMWSNQNDSTMYFAFHQDGAADTAWTVNPAVQSPGYADDHMNLKSLQADAEGRVYAITKTSLSGTGSPLILLLVLDKQGSWKRHTFARHEDRLTRPIILIDDEAKKLYGFAAGPDAGGIVYYKETPLDNIGFATGKGEPFIEGIEDSNVNNPSSTKQTINSTTGVVVIAADDVTDHYLHNDLLATAPQQDDVTPPETSVDSGPASTVTETAASFEFSSSESGSTFECRLDGAAFSSCTSPKSYSGLAVGDHVFEVRATDAAGNTDSTPASHAWTIAESGSAVTVTSETVADARVREAAPAKNYGTSYLFADAGSGVHEESNLRFDVSGVSGQVQKATLRVYASSGTVDGPAVYQTTGAWTESELTWSNRPARSGGAIDELGSIASGSWAEYDVTTAVSGDGTYDFVLVTDSTDGVRFRSREETPTPQLVITSQ